MLQHVNARQNHGSFDIILSFRDWPILDLQVGQHMQETDIPFNAMDLRDLATTGKLDDNDRPEHLEFVSS
ncbi:hypothetical protein MPTK1_3g04240 [Marchantia polymorpha subsp. ruderalis]|uniref:Uncharacterized protein n=2 Tax=Marchantia polymorpha TaxID=3197 RepID=A0AAF6AXB4_MARPO|nr:hypothetical protein MARPO_0022s0107 [Marchantia polymorpha]BBN04398.1 hypothetical protein Mp_3g04240 [Marchantia polymorpha subsp. ruderalis]|eukprot:PTQ44006.1 hypothetical protein MARPO_0022s0107 [Marchantia polymorpha]